MTFAVPAEVAFDYLVDPRNRPEWQPSLRAVEVLDDDVAEGQRWVDVTVPGLRPRMQTTALRRPTYWEERGQWHGITVRVALTFTATTTPTGAGCEVEVDCPRWARRFAESDLRRAARLLGQR